MGTEASSVATGLKPAVGQGAAQGQQPVFRESVYQAAGLALTLSIKKQCFGNHWAWLKGR